MRFHWQVKPTDILVHAPFTALCTILGIVASWGLVAMLYRNSF